jgi:hypothetical protein
VPHGSVARREAREDNDNTTEKIKQLRCPMSSIEDWASQI